MLLCFVFGYGWVGLYIPTAHSQHIAQANHKHILKYLLMLCRPNVLSLFIIAEFIECLQFIPMYAILEIGLTIKYKFMECYNLGDVVISSIDASIGVVVGTRLHLSNEEITYFVNVFNSDVELVLTADKLALFTEFYNIKQ